MEEVESEIVLSRRKKLFREVDVDVRLPKPYRTRLRRLAEEWGAAPNDWGGIRAKQRVIYELIVRRQVRRIKELRENDGALKGYTGRKRHWVSVPKEVAKEYTPLFEEEGDIAFLHELAMSAKEILEEVEAEGVDAVIEREVEA